MAYEKTNFAASIVILSVPAVAILIGVYFTGAYFFNKNTYASNMKRYEAGTADCKRIEDETVAYLKKLGDKSDPVIYTSGVRHVLPTNDMHILGCFYPNKPIPPEFKDPSYSKKFNTSQI